METELSRNCHKLSIVVELVLFLLTQFPMWGFIGRFASPPVQSWATSDIDMKAMKLWFLGVALIATLGSSTMDASIVVEDFLVRCRFYTECALPPVHAS